LPLKLAGCVSRLFVTSAIGKGVLVIVAAETSEQSVEKAVFYNVATLSEEFARTVCRR
jgi:hypothetical protein